MSGRRQQRSRNRDRLHDRRGQAEVVRPLRTAAPRLFSSSPRPPALFGDQRAHRAKRGQLAPYGARPLPFSKPTPPGQRRADHRGRHLGGRGAPRPRRAAPLPRRSARSARHLRRACFGEAEQPLGHHVPLDLVRPGVDRAGEREEKAAVHGPSTSPSVPRRASAVSCSRTSSSDQDSLVRLDLRSARLAVGQPGDLLEREHLVGLSLDPALHDPVAQRRRTGARGTGQAAGPRSP